MATFCSACNSKDIYLDEAAGNFTCTQCGLVLEENTIVSTIEFQETGDRSHVIGRHVSYTAAMSNSGGLYSGGYGAGNSRENTLAKAKIKIKAVADSVGNLVSTDLDMVGMAHQYYKLALGKNFLSGRKSEHVAVACLYLVCRKNKTDHLLIDFSDSTQSNIYNLGKVFVQLIQILQEHHLPIVDPSLFIHRYVKKLDLEEKLVKPVTVSALRIITRMKKDWLTQGRRPDGICAAAILIATRAHGITKSQQDVARLFRISDETMRLRLKEFSQTAVAQLSLEDFRTMTDKTFEELNESWEEMDPPAFRRSKQSSLELEEAEDESHSVAGQSLTVRKKAFLELYDEIYRELNDETLGDDEDERLDDEAMEVAPAPRRGRRPSKVSSAAATTASAEDDEVNECLLDNAEQNSRTNVWESEYRKVLTARESQRKIREAEDLSRGSRLTKTGKKRKVSERRDAPKDSARSAVENTLVNTSKKINYSAIGESFREDGSFKSPEEVARSSSAAGRGTREPGREQGQMLSTILAATGSSGVEEEEEEAVAQEDVDDEDEYDHDQHEDEDYEYY